MSETPSNGAMPIARVLDFLGLHSIKNRILLLAVVATLVPALSTAGLSYRQSRRALAANLSGELRSRGAQGAREIDLWLKERQYDVRVFTGSFEISENLERVRDRGTAGDESRGRLRDYLAGVGGRFTDYAELLVLDADAIPIASSLDSPSPVSLAADLQTRLANGETILAEPRWDEENSTVDAVLAVPIQDADGRFLGTLAATLTFDAAGALLEDMAPGEGGRIDLFASDGLLLATSTMPGGLSAEERADAETLRALADAGASVVEYDGREGIEVVGASTPVAGLGWSVVAQIPSEVAYAQVAELRSSTALLVSFLVVILGGIAYLLGSVIVRPLELLTEGAGAVASGDLSVDLPEVGRGEVGYLTRVFNDMVSRLRASREELDARSHELELVAVTDLLTGLRNRRFLIEAFEKEMRRADRHERPFCVLMIDVDRFKQFNDTYGHLAGDSVLAVMGRVLSEAIRDLDVAARYGGEEFIVLLPECNVEGAIMAAERIRARLAREEFEYGPVTISVGAAGFPMHGETPAAVIAAADGALYEAKRLGRDRVCGAPPPPSEADEPKEKAAKRTTAAKQKRGSGRKKATATGKTASVKNSAAEGDAS